MKYFTKEFIRAYNSPTRSAAERKRMDRKLRRNSRAYGRQLEKLRTRLSRQAWNFFYCGFARWGLHDARLLSFVAGDGLDYQANGKYPFRRNNQKLKVRIQILNYQQNLLYTFTCTGIRKAVFDFPTEDPLWVRGQVDDLHSYELTAVNRRFLRLEFLFVSGSTILVEFARLKFRRQRIKRRYPIGRIYA